MPLANELGPAHYAVFLATKTEEQLLTAIRAQQAIQKRNPPSSVAWESASRALSPLFREMALRHPGKGPAL